MTEDRYDVAIVGGGMVGASLGVALSGSVLRVALIEGFDPGAPAQPSFDDRTTALGNGSRAAFEALGMWRAMASEAGAIRAIHVSDAGRFGFARLVASELGIEAFGHVVPNRVIGRALWARLLEAPNVTRFVPARTREVAVTREGVRLGITRGGAATDSIDARLLVAADGAQSGLRDALGLAARIEDYEQVAVVVNVRADRPNDGTAWERFTAAGPLAVLPLADGSYTVVWTLAPAEAERVRTLGDTEVLGELQRAFGWRAGRFVRAGTRGAYPLALTRSEQTSAPRAVLVGNAAQALHPVAGQGFNLGLRDAAALAELLVAEGGDVGDAEFIARFESWRASDRRGVTRFTDGLVKLFADTRPGVGLARDVGLLLFDLAPPAQRALSRVSWGLAGRLPRLSRGVALR